MVTTKEKPIIDAHKIMIKKSKHTAPKTHQVIKDGSKIRSMEQRIYKTGRKQLTKWQNNEQNGN